MSEEIAIYNPESQQSLENFIKLVNSYPAKTEKISHSQARKTKPKRLEEIEYLPINVIERKLDEIYSGLWSDKNFRVMVIANEIFGILDLHVFHPVAKIWIQRTGTFGLMIQTEAGKPAILENKIKNALGKGAGNLKSMCIKNAAKSLGVAFGRNLNRGEEDEYQYLSESLPELNELQKQAMTLLGSSTLDNEDAEKVRAKIVRSNNKTLKQVVEYLKNKQ